MSRPPTPATASNTGSRPTTPSGSRPTTPSGSRPTTPAGSRPTTPGVAPGDTPAEEEAKEPEIVLKKNEELFHADKHPAYVPYFKQIITGVPRQTVEAAMKAKNLNPEYLDTPKKKIIFKGKPAHKVTALELLAIEEARLAIQEEKDELEATLAITNPLDNIDWSVPEYQGLVGKFRKVRRIIQEKKKAFEQKNFYKYGPPYSDDYGGSIIDECNKAQPSWYDIHQMLTDGADPNVVHDDVEERGNTPMHYVARHCQFNIAKMLVRAEAAVDRINDLGITPLGTLCMFPPPEPRKGTHLRYVQWLLDQGVDANHVDKGGHTALEFAATHGNVELVALLLKHGVRVKRDAEFISLETVNLLDENVVWDLTCRSLIRSKYNEEIRLEEEARLAIKRVQDEKEALERDKIRRQLIIQNRLKKQNAMSDRLAYEDHLKLEAMKAKSRDEAKKKRAAMLEEKIADNGEWKKAGDLDWQFIVGKKTKKSVQGSAYEEALYLQTEMEDQHAEKLMNARWKEITGHVLLTKEDVHDMKYGIDDGKVDDAVTKKEKKEGDSDTESDDFDTNNQDENANRRGTVGKMEEKDKIVFINPKLMKRSITGHKIKVPRLLT